MVINPGFEAVAGHDSSVPTVIRKSPLSVNSQKSLVTKYATMKIIIR